MKNIILAMCSIVFAAILSLSAYAETTSPSPAAQGPTMNGAAGQGIAGMAAKGDKPCHRIAEACKSAGYVRGGTNGKGIMKNCLKPIMSGQSVSGVNVSSVDIAACKAKRHAHKGM